MGKFGTYSELSGSTVALGDLFIVKDVSATATKAVSMETLWQYRRDYGGSRWLQVDTSDYSTTPASTSTITMNTNLTAEFFPGMPVQYTISGTTYYGMITAMASNLMTITGASLTGTFSDLRVGTPEMVFNGHFYIGGDYDAGTADLLPGMEWLGRDGYLVTFAAAHTTVDTGASQPKLNIEVAGSSVSNNDSSNGIQMSGSTNTWVQNSAIAINTSNYAVTYGDEIRPTLTVPGSNGDAEGLSISYVIVRA